MNSPYQQLSTMHYAKINKTKQWENDSKGQIPENLGTTCLF